MAAVRLPLGAAGRAPPRLVSPAGRWVGGRRGLEPRPGGVGRPGHLLWLGACPGEANSARLRSPGASGGAEGRARQAAPGSPASAPGVSGFHASGPLAPRGAPPLYGEAGWLSDLQSLAGPRGRPCWWLQRTPCPTPPPFSR